MNDTPWLYRDPAKIKHNSLTVEVIADYAGGYTLDHAFNEVHQHFRRFDRKHLINQIVPHPVHAFSTIETGYWIAQMALHSEHEDLLIFSNTAPRGDIAWNGEKHQAFVYALLDNDIPVFAVHAGYNLSFIKDRIKGVWEVNVSNTGTQFRSRDQYPEAMVEILYGKKEFVGKKLSIRDIPEVPSFAVASIDGYGNIKTTIRRSELPESVRKAKNVRVAINGTSQYALNSIHGDKKGKIGDLCMVVGSSGGKKNPFIEFIELQRRADREFGIIGPKDDLGRIELEAA